jgi:threonine dehydrogenase-like Zn-dependent dehydrogenase
VTLSLGTVQAVGKDVETLRVGTRVVVFPWIGCGQCSRCKQGHDNFCDGAPPIPHPLFTRTLSGVHAHPAADSCASQVLRGRLASHSVAAMPNP